MPFAVRSRQADGVTVVMVGGEVDVETAPRMRAALHAAVRAGAPVVVDVGGVTFMDSFGFGVLVAAHREGRRSGTPVLLRAVSTRIFDLLTLLGLDRELDFEAARDPTA
jgi:anti-sigma B factor antagonist